MEEQHSGFPPGANWSELVPLTKAVAKVKSDGLRSPTMPENEVVSAPNFNFGETFDREPFTELCMVYISVQLVKDRRGSQVKGKGIRNEGRANAEWLVKKNHHGIHPLKTG
jgi:hypothetical protein